MTALRKTFDYEAIVVGSGFAGAVTACRLSEAGLAVCLLERGRRYGPDDMPVYPADARLDAHRDDGKDRLQPDFTRMFWAVGQGLWDFRDLGDVVSGQAAGYGGGSLIYANVHLRPPPDVFDDWPEPYRSPTFGPYFDLAAYMLGVDRPPGGPEGPRAYAKAARLEEAGRALGLRTFQPPLAVNFGNATAEQNAAVGTGEGHAVCDDRADCCLGCPKQAKNTLDLNYLAKAERYGAQVRTLAEVVSIERATVGGEPGWAVAYRDHLARGRLDLAAPGRPVRGLTEVTARYLFLCAGAVNTTELLLRNAARIAPARREVLGRFYFSNVDTLATVYDCDGVQDPDRGPTITTCLVYDGPEGLLLVQDGGMPSAMEPTLGSFRSPLWGHRNRFRNEPVSSEGFGLPSTGYAPLPFDTIADILSGIPRGAMAGLPAASHAIGESLGAQSRRDDWSGEDDGEIRTWSLLPRQVREQLEILGWDLLCGVSSAAQPLVGRFLDDAAAKAEGNHPVEALAAAKSFARGLNLSGLENQNVARRLVRLGLQLVWGGEGELVLDIATRALESVLPRPSLLADRLSGLLQWALDYRLGSPHTGMLLSMGLDSRPGTLALARPGRPGQRVTQLDSRAAGTLLHADEHSLVVELTSDAEFAADDEKHVLVDGVVVGRAAEVTPLALGGASAPLGLGPLARLSLQPLDPARGTEALPLEASLPEAIDTPERAAQELLLRSVAETWKAELRTNPLWTFLDRRLTVHSLGGCAMDAPANGGSGFTSPGGEVHGCPGLYVMDAAAFATSVGTNPSATIAAVAEYKVEQFLRRHTSDPQWQARETAAASAWAVPRKHFLNPLGARRARRDRLPATVRPIGLAFSETMRGDHHPIGRARGPGNMGDARAIDLELHARIGDLAQFLDEHRLGRSPTIPLTGTVTIVTAPRGTGSIREVASVEGAMTLFSGGPRRRRIEYDLTFGDWRLHGQKDIRDDPRFDAWKDTTALSFELAHHGVPAREGLVRLSASDFFGGQLPSFEVFGTKDPARIVWAQATFAAFFFGHLVDVYAPAFDRIGELLRGVGRQAHV